MNRDKAGEALNCVLRRVKATLKETGNAFPYYYDPSTDRWVTTVDGNWCAGHWIGLLWLAAKYAESNDEKVCLQEAARAHTAVMKSSIDKFRTSLFAGLNFNIAGFQGYDFTGDRELFSLGFTGADIVMSLYNEHAQQIASGVYFIEGPQHELTGNVTGKGWGWVTSGFETSAVDSAHAAVPILLRAYKESKDLRFRDTALSHLEIYLKRFIRNDGSTRQLIKFDPVSGKVLQEYKNLSSDVTGCWARGFGWCVSGLSEVWNNIRAKRYLYALESLAGYYKLHSNEDLVPCWDMKFDASSGEPRDTSCAALVAIGLTSLDGTEDEVGCIRRLGESVLESLVDNYMVRDNTDKCGMLTGGCYSKPKNYAVDTELIWSEYYLAFALDNYLEKD